MKKVAVNRVSGDWGEDLNLVKREIAKIQAQYPEKIEVTEGDLTSGAHIWVGYPANIAGSTLLGVVESLQKPGKWKAAELDNRRDYVYGLFGPREKYDALLEKLIPSSESFTLKEMIDLILSAREKLGPVKLDAWGLRMYDPETKEVSGEESKSEIPEQTEEEFMSEVMGTEYISKDEWEAACKSLGATEFVEENGTVVATDENYTGHSIDFDVIYGEWNVSKGTGWTE